MPNENRPRKSACDHAIVRLVLDRTDSKVIARFATDEPALDDLRFECRSCGEILRFLEILKPVLLGRSSE